jgi:general secretion pathway protein F
VLTRQLATLIGAGIPLFESLNALIEQVENEVLKRALTEVREQVREGISFAKALEAHPGIFPVLYVNMVRAGEASGTLEQVLERLTQFMERRPSSRARSPRRSPTPSSWPSSASRSSAC